RDHRVAGDGDIVFDDDRPLRHDGDVRSDVAVRADLDVADLGLDRRATAHDRAIADDDAGFAGAAGVQQAIPVEHHAVAQGDAVRVPQRQVGPEDDVLPRLAE